MAILNGGLARTLGSTAAAAVVLLAVGLLSASVALLASGTGAALTRVAAAPWHLALGGVIVAFYVLSVTVLVPVFGVGNTILCIMVTQIVVSSTIDHFGLLGAPLRPLDGVRLAGIWLLIAGLLVTQLGGRR
jgi:transporter family-2 protein